MNRQTLINTLLIIAGIVLAFALFAAGVYWRSRTGSRGGQADPPTSAARESRLLANAAGVGPPRPRCPLRQAWYKHLKRIEHSASSSYPLERLEN